MQVTAMIVAIAAAAALRSTTLGGPKIPLDQVDLIKHEKPFSDNVVPDMAPMASCERIRRYTIHVSFDEAVTSIEKELGKAIWNHNVVYEKADLNTANVRLFNGVYVSGEVVVQRGKTIFNAVRPKGVSGIGGSEQLLREFHFPKVDPTNWVTVSIIQSFRVDSLNSKSALPALTHNKARSYCVVYWMSKNRLQLGPVDVHKGTANLEGRGGLMFDFYRSGGEG